LLVRWLTEAGYVVETDDDAQPQTIALVIADVPHPVQAGVALSLIAARYEAPIVAMSGRFRRSGAATESAARRLGVARILPKPFTGKELLAAVRACLGGDP
jgi:DNA-binding response OmpR family regulator